MQQRLTRSRSERVIWGVCGGLGLYFGVDPVIVRLIFIVLALTTGISIIAYPLLALAMPVDRSGRAQGAGFQPPAGAAPAPPSIGKTISLRVDEAPEARYVPPQPGAPQRTTRDRWRTLGIVLLGIGVFVLARQFGLRADLVWPALIIGLGIWLMRRRI